jgi:hypothetical protein
VKCHEHKKNSVVAIYNTHTGAERAVKELEKSGFDMKKLSLIGKDHHAEEVNKAHDILSVSTASETNVHEN